MAKGKNSVLVMSNEDRALELLLGEKKTVNETQIILRAEGYEPLSENQLRRIKKQGFEKLVTEQRAEVAAEFMLESIKKVTIKFEDFFVKLEALYARAEEEGNIYEQITVLNQIKDALNMALKKLGAFKTGIERIQAENVTINNADVMVAIRDNQQMWFEKMSPELKKGKLIFNKPTPEVIDAYHRWKFQSGRL